MEQGNKKSNAPALLAIFTKSVLAGGMSFIAMGIAMSAITHDPQPALSAYFGGVVAVAYGATRVMMRKDTGASCCEHHKPKEP